MGFFSRKKKSSKTNITVNSASSSSTPASPALSTQSASPILPSPAYIPVDPPVSLHVVLDASELDPFVIEVSKEDDVMAIRRALAVKLGSVSMSLFKVAIPLQAVQQARTYSDRYSLPVNLITSFPSFNIDDPAQLAPSLGPAAWAVVQNSEAHELRVKDWFPEPYTDMITLLVRKTAGPITSIPYTFLVHMALPLATSSSCSLRSPVTPASPVCKVARSSPAVVDILPELSVDGLKAAVLRADPSWTHNAAEVELSKVVLWRVEMSEEEMIVIEERGGLKCGQMPWPYPPTAPVPTGLVDSTLPISHYFPSHHSNTSMISLSTWIHQSASTLRADSSLADCPRFRYPMLFPDSGADLSATVRSRSSSIASGSTARPPSAVSYSTPVLGSNMAIEPFEHRPRLRNRPSTAPAFVPSASSSSSSSSSSSIPAVPAFGAGSKSLSRRVPRSRLHTSHVPSTTPPSKGLGINLSPDISSGSSVYLSPVAQSPTDFLTPTTSSSSANNVSYTPTHTRSSTTHSSHSPDFYVAPPLHRPSNASDISTTSTGSAISTSDEEDNLPALDFSLLSFDARGSISGVSGGSGHRSSCDHDSDSSRAGYGSELTTPTTEKTEWLVWAPAPGKKSAQGSLNSQKGQVYVQA